MSSNEHGREGQTGANPSKEDASKQGQQQQSGEQRKDEKQTPTPGGSQQAG